MSDSNDDKTISVSLGKVRPSRWNGPPFEQGMVAPGDWSQAAPKAVVVETRKRRLSRPGMNPSAARDPKPAPRAVAEKPKEPVAPPPPLAPAPTPAPIRAAAWRRSKPAFGK